MEDPKESNGQESANREQESANREPLGFAEHTRKSSGERAHEQGWGLNEDERRKLTNRKQDYEGGIDYNYGAQDFGDTAVDTGAAKPAVSTLDAAGRHDEAMKKGSGERKAVNQRTSARRG
ncbi:MAG TPA: hypothetical protein VHZ09_11370 [Acidobacteriaceae bacterium]|jgi:hypothetical protein|nr:hypothetical protein [Acidobacteriaceae bacterium]